MDTSRRFELLLLLFLMAITFQSRSVEPRAMALALQNPPISGDTKELARALGMVCNCCDGVEGDECRSSWEGRCTELRCFPWKYA
ncbi:hypothetical protein NMG60_11012379 [Bertholletia excelsa]